MKLLLDTHAVLWFLEGAPQLSEAARLAVEDEGNESWVSTASGWEMAIKSQIGKLRLPLPFEELFPSALEARGFFILPVQAGHLHRYHALPFHHRDRFDRLLVAQALSRTDSPSSVTIRPSMPTGFHESGEVTASTPAVKTCLLLLPAERGFHSGCARTE